MSPTVRDPERVSGDPLPPMSVIVPWRPGLWLVEATRNLKASLTASVALCALFALILASAVWAEQATIRQLTNYEEQLRHDGGWSLVVEPSDGAVVSGPRCERLAALAGVAAAGAIISRNGRVQMLSGPGTDLPVSRVSPSLVELLSGEAVPSDYGLIGGRGYSADYGMMTDSLVSIADAGDLPSRSSGPMKLRIYDLSRLGIVSDGGLVIVERAGDHVDACVVEFEPNVPEDVQRSLASLASSNGRAPKLTGFVAVPTGDQSLPSRYRQRSTRLLPFTTSVLGAIISLGSFARRRPELAMYQLAGARGRTARLVIVGEFGLLLGLAGGLVFSGFLIGGLTTHGLIQLVACLGACCLAAIVVGFVMPLGSLAEALKDS